MNPLPALLLAAAVGGLGALLEPGAGAQARGEVPGAPRIELRAPEELSPQANRVAAFDPARLLAVMRLVGLEDAGAPIPVFLLPEDAPLARETPVWVAGFASGREVVLFPARAPSYPHDSLQELLQHEVAHVLIYRAAGGRPVPRWFHEGVALTAERTWSLLDRTHFAMDMAFGGRVPAGSLDELFEPATVRRAYRLSGAIVQDLLKVHGPNLAASILEGMRGGMTFEAAFHAAAGITVDEAVDRFWNRRRLWLPWLPWLTSAGALWVLMTLLAIAAFVAARWRRARRRRRWEEEEGDGEM